MHLRALIVLLGIGVGIQASALAKDQRPRSNNPNVKRAMKKAKKVRPAKYKTPKKSKKPAHVTYGSR
jgi:hypothetical protein